MSGRRLDARRLALVTDRFTSPHDGERLAALEAAGRILAAGGATWRSLIDVQGDDHASTSRDGVDEGEPVAAPHTDTVKALARAGAEILTPWERQFLTGLLTFRTLSKKQRRTLAAIQVKVEAMADDWCNACRRRRPARSARVEASAAIDGNKGRRRGHGFSRKT